MGPRGTLVVPLVPPQPLKKCHVPKKSLRKVPVLDNPWRRSLDPGAGSASTMFFRWCNFHSRPRSLHPWVPDNHHDAAMQEASPRGHSPAGVQADLAVAAGGGGSGSRPAPRRGRGGGYGLLPDGNCGCPRGGREKGREGGARVKGALMQPAPPSERSGARL